jgi:hypothetical protein
MKITTLFTFSYGTKLDFNKMTICEKSDDDAVDFVTRSAKNLGIGGTVKKIQGLVPFPDGLITVTLGGTLLSSFVQQNSFYTAQNIMVLTPINEMTFREKLFYCLCISKNRFRYSTFGREANRTLKNLELPDKIPEWVNSKELLSSIRKKIMSDFTGDVK